MSFSNQAAQLKVADTRRRSERPGAAAVQPNKVCPRPNPMDWWIVCGDLWKISVSLLELLVLFGFLKLF